MPSLYRGTLEADQHMCRADVYEANESYRRHGLKGVGQLNSLMEILLQHTFNAASPRYTPWEIDREPPGRAISLPPTAWPPSSEPTLATRYPDGPTTW